jgi:dienelactone hydrolase
VYVFRPAFEESLEYASEEDVAAATILVEQTAGPILMLAGDDDQLWPSCTLAEIAEARLAPAHSQTYADEYVCYPEAGHFIVVPGGPTTGSDMFANDDGTWWLVGGTPRGNAHGQRDALERTLRFLGEALGEPGL